ncbi:MAG: glycosyltransferase family 2 protein [Prevotella sp.]|jgi:GT2 family glycosyltransferase|nr:glycosyltransferase family 2 protein [Prevotella sp.]
MKLSIVIVSYNVCQLLDECLQSVERALDGIDGDIYVVDNCSSDGTVDTLRPKHPQVHFIANAENVGFARANNQAIRQSDSEYVLLLNPDTVVYEPTIKGCLDFMDQHPEAGGAGVRMLTREGTVAPESRRAVPTPWVSMLKMLGFTRRYYMSYLPWDEPSQIEVISGAYCLLRRKALDQVGLLDEDFFMYGEDIDLSYRLLKGGWQNWFLPFDIIHYKGESTQKSSFRYVHVFYQAMLIFFRKHYGHLSFLLSLPIKTAIYFRAFLALLHMLTDRLQQFLNPRKDNHS